MDESAVRPRVSAATKVDDEATEDQAAEDQAVEHQVVDGGAAVGAGSKNAAAGGAEAVSRPRDAAATRARILAAAAEEFAAKGIAGARIDDIAAGARTNKRMLYYYFGSKEELFREVLQRELSARIERVAQLPGDRIERLVDRQAFHLADRDYVRLLQWEALERAGSEPLDNGERAASVQAWVESVRADQRAGRLPDDVEAGQLVLSELALTLFPAAFPQFTRWITGLDVDDPQFLDERQAFLRTFATRFLHASPPSQPSDADDR